MAQKNFQIGDLANATGLTPDAIRYYERQNLLPKAQRTTGGFRTYDASAIERIEFVRRAKAHGLTLREIKELVSYQASAGRGGCQSVHDLLSRKLKELDTRRIELDEFSAMLRTYLAMCERALTGRSKVECPVVEDLGTRKETASK
jgi:MerR family Zn(II)-responsive transcriptional regulator of zntA